MKDDTAGDPMTGIKWTHKTTEKISRELCRAGIRVSAKTVGRLLDTLDFRLYLNRKTIANGSGPDRDRQYRRIQLVRKRFQRAGEPVISVDTKKREMIGCFKNPGTRWGQTPVPVNDHDFLRNAKGVAISYGIFDPQANRGHIFVGTSHDTAEFAGDAIAAWWSTEGHDRYPGTERLLIMADCGGSNGYRTAAWKYAVQTKLSDAFGLTVTVAHYPPGASKWNPIEHRLFSEISKNWAGHPLLSYETMLKHIRRTRTEQGLRVQATLLRGTYPTGQKPTAEQMARLNIRRSRVLPAWCYTIAPGREM